MTCEELELELFDFHEAKLTLERRREVEEHLLECSDCLRSYLALKRQAEVSRIEAVPSEASRMRLRRELARAIEPPQRTRPTRRWERPFAVGVALATVLLAMASTHVVMTQPGRPPQTLEGSERP